MHTILVGVDGSPGSLGALAWAADMARRAGIELVAARVFVPTQAELPPDRDAALHDEQRHELEAWCSSEAVAAARPRTALLDGSPADALLAAAGDEQADLLVVGGRGTGGFRHLHLGSVAHHLAHHTTLPLAIVPPTGDGPVRHLVLGVDGSPGSRAAAALAAGLAAGLAVPVTAVYAFEPALEWVPEDDPRSWRAQVETEVRGWVEAADEAGVTLAVEIDRDRHPVAALARALEAHPGAAAVVGTRGVGGFTGLRLGRVPLQLVHHIGAPVVLVPPAPER